MAKAWQAAATGPERSNAFIGVLTGDAPDIVDNWAESYLRQGLWQDPWIMYGFGLPDAAQVTQHPVQAQTDPGWIGSVNSRANTVLDVTATSGEVVIVVTDGLASVHDGGSDSYTAFQSQTFCTTDSCVCPPGTLLAGRDMASQHLAIPFVAAINGAVGGSKYAIIADTLDHLCRRQPTPQPGTPHPQGTPNYGPCGANCSQSNGDPHILTLNKSRYDFQAAGEFTLLRSADKSLDIQARQEPFGEGFAAINTAIAAKVGSHRVGVYMNATSLQAHLDGSVLDLGAGPKDLGGGASIAAIDKGYQIDFPDGTQLWTMSLGQYGINALVKPSAGLRASGVGLLGPVIPGGLGVPAMPDGSRLPAATSDPQRKSIVDGRFADAWRLTDSTTLFDYSSGKTTASYTIKPFPLDPKYGGTSDLSAAQTAAGDAACSSITDADLHDECVFDVGVTGKAGFGNLYSATQGFYETGVTVASATPKPSARPASPLPGLVSGAVTVATGATLGGYALGPDDTAYISAQTGDNTFTLIAFDTRSGKIAAQVGEPAMTPVHFASGAVWLPGLKTDSNGRNCSITRLDATTLAEVATIPTPCSAFGNVGPVASDGDAVWFLDTSKVDIATNLGAVITRIDPTTNQPGTSVPMATFNGYFQDSIGAFFYYDNDRNYFRLTTGSTTFDRMGSFKAYFSTKPGGTGLWAEGSDGKTGLYFSQPGGTPQATVQVGGGLVAGDTKAVYIDVFGNNDQGVAQDQLWRYPLDGSTPTEIGIGPTIDNQGFGYVADPQAISNGDGVLKLWTTRTGSQQLPTILLQWTPTR